MLPGLLRPVLPHFPTEIVLVLRKSRDLRRILGATGLSLDDMVNSPFAKGRILGYFKLSREIIRRGEVLDLERQWNPLGLRA